MGIKGPNRDSNHHAKSQETRVKNDKDEAVARDPDIRGAEKRGSRDEKGKGR